MNKVDVTDFYMGTIYCDIGDIFLIANEPYMFCRTNSGLNLIGLVDGNRYTDDFQMGDNSFKISQVVTNINKYQEGEDKAEVIYIGKCNITIKKIEA